MADALAPVRRLVTGVDESGRSRIVEDGVSPAVFTIEGLTGYRNNNLWRTLGPTSPVDAPDSVLEHAGVLPPPGGTILRVIDIPPNSDNREEMKEKLGTLFSSMFPDAQHRPDDRDPGMHMTTTVDYAILLSGELVAIMDDGEATMRAGDVLIQRGTNHGWANRSNTIARIVFILVDAASAA
jgi:hypothetical protein